MRILKIFGIAFVTGLSGAMMPGPLLALTIGQVSLQGWMAVPLIMLGHAALELIVVALLIAGLVQALSRRWPRGAIGIVGGGALIYMGVDMALHASSVALVGPGEAEILSWGKLILAGAAISMANPYFVGWWATIGAGGMAQLAPRSAAEYLSFYVGHELSDFGWYGIVGLVLISGKNLLGPQVYGVLVLACGVAIVVLGGWFLVTGAQVLRGKVLKR